MTSESPLACALERPGFRVGSHAGIALRLVARLALWRSARRNELIWFVFLLIVNSIGILPIIYLLLTRGKAEKDARKSG